MRMPSFVAVHAHPPCRTVSCMSLTVDIVSSSMGGTTPVCYSTSLMRRWILIPAGSSTLSTTCRHSTAELEERAEKMANITPGFKAKIRCSSYVCPGSSCHTYGQNVSIENQCLYYIVSYYKSRRTK
jgi:hypothetical protein